MNLNFRQICRITNGAERIAEENEGIGFYRFNNEEALVYSKTNYSEASVSCSGIEMEFKTDGDCLRLKVDVKKCTGRTYFAFDIFANDAFIGSISNVENMEQISGYPDQSYPLGEYDCTFGLGDGEKTVRIVFPFTVAVKIKEMVLENATFVEGVKKRKTIVSYGDSITHGNDALHPANTYAAKLAQSLGAELFNKGIGGEIFFPELAETKASNSPDYVTVAYGSNDWSRLKKDEFEIRCRRFLEGIIKKYPESIIFVISPIWAVRYDGQGAFGDIRELEICIKEICDKLKIVNYISGWNLMPHDESMLADRWTHPNDEGFRNYFECLEKQVKNIIGDITNE